MANIESQPLCGLEAGSGKRVVLVSTIDVAIRIWAATDDVVHNGFVYSRYCPFGQRLCSINDEASDPFHAVWDIKVIQEKQREYGTNVQRLLMNQQVTKDCL